MSHYLRLASLALSITLLSGCQAKKEQEEVTKTEVTSTVTDVEENKKRVDKVLEPRSFTASKKSILTQAYLRDVLPDSSFAYVRIPNPWALTGVPVGNIFDKGVASQPYVDAVSSIREGFAANVMPELPDDARVIISLLLQHTTSAIEAALVVAEVKDGEPNKKVNIPNLLVTVAVDYKNAGALNTLLDTLVAKEAMLTLEKHIEPNASGIISGPGVKAHIKLDTANSRLHILIGNELQTSSIDETLKKLVANPKHPMRPFEKEIDASGQGIFYWMDPREILTLASAMGKQREAAPLMMMGANSIKSIAMGLGSSGGINRYKVLMDMPRAGFRAMIPAIENTPEFKLAGQASMVAVVGLPSKSDYLSYESMAAAATPPQKMEEYYNIKEKFSEKAGIEIEDLFDILGQDISFVFDEAGFYTAVRLKNAEKFNTMLTQLVEKFELKYEKRTITGQQYHHLRVPSFDSVIFSEFEKKSPNDKDIRLIKRFMGVSGHLFWQQEGDYLITASLPQILMDRHYAAEQVSVAEWFKEKQRINPEGALLMASMRNKGVPAFMYQLKLSILNYLGEVVGRPIDLFSLPSSREIGLPKEGAYSFKLTSNETQLAFELSFESNPAEILMAGNGYAGIAIAGILASIAMPAFNDYTLRAEVAGGLLAAKSVVSLLELYKIENGKFPSQQEAESIDQSGWRHDAYQISIDDNGNIDVEFKNKNLSSGIKLLKPIDGRITWKCQSNMNKKNLPAGCRF
ncbi:MAG: pilin [Cocleimonas sp.]